VALSGAVEGRTYQRWCVLTSHPRIPLPRGGQRPPVIEPRPVFSSAPGHAPQ
jgi:hypothetical protein